MTLPLNLRKKNHFLDKEGRPIPGVCCVCGCEEDNPCPEGCWWANYSQTLCSTCHEVLFAGGRRAAGVAALVPGKKRKRTKEVPHGRR